MNSRQRAWAAAAAVGLIVAAGLLWWWPGPVVVPPPAEAPLVSGAAAQSAPPAAASAPAVLHPVEAAASATAPPLAEADLGAALFDLLGRKAVLGFLQTDEFARRFVATVDNLGRSHAPTTLWPVNPTPGKFTVVERDGGMVIDAGNGQRYTPFVLLLEGLNTGRAMSLYVRMYPLLQRAYEELGYPKRYFNDRLVEVIDLMLATPEASSGIKLQLTEVRGPIASTRPWVRYELVEPRLETLAAGQKLMLRVGPVNQRRLKARLVAWRKALTQAAAAR